MHIAIRNIGNSRGIVFPKALLRQAGLDGVNVAAVAVEDGTIVLRKPPKAAREGWAQAAQAVAAGGGDALVMGEFGNDGDEALTW